MNNIAAKPIRPKPERISKRESVWLDLVRALAAFMVIVDHAPSIFDMPYAPRFGHQAVVVFFVLSGYVISNVADTRENRFLDFAAARLSRLWSVLIPALVLTVVCDFVGRHFGNPIEYIGVPADHIVIRLGLVTTFLSESWISAQPLSNGVVWSLAAEFWYYAAFAAWTFAEPGWRRKIWVGLTLFLAGLKGLLLLPIWVMGVLAQRSGSRKGKIWVAIWVLGIIGTCTLSGKWIYDPAIDFMRHFVGKNIEHYMAQARVFWLDWGLGIAVTSAILGGREVASYIPFERIKRPIAWCAGVSFWAYLVHEPFLRFLGAFMSPAQGWLAVLITTIFVGVTGHFIEDTKFWWRRWISYLLNIAFKQKTIAPVKSVST
jgi:peptidoglycan/LPS O-acetylase OafA/YrhL